MLSRRGFVHAGVIGTAGLSLANLLRSEATAAEQKGNHLARSKTKNNVILLWMRGGPSHIDMRRVVLRKLPQSLCWQKCMPTSSECLI